MKKCFIVIVLLALLSTGWQRTQAQIIYSSGNPAVNPAITDSSMLHLDLTQVFELNQNDPQLHGGILGNAAGGNATLSMYYYDPRASDGKGGLLYRCTSSSNSGNYVENSVTFSKQDWIWLVVTFWPTEVTWQSTNIREMSVRAGLAGYHLDSPTDPFSSISAHALTKQIPVIVEASVQNATVSKLKIPVLGEFDFNDLFTPTRPIAAIGGKVTLCSHRGNWQDVNAPENTINATHDMLAQHYDMIELDLWSTLDNQLIVFHDMGLNKRTTLTGSVKAKNWSDLQNLYIKNRFDEVIQSPTTQMSLLRDMLNYINQQDTSGKVFINLDRSANDINFFKQVFLLVDSMNMLDRVIFKGRFNPDPDANGEIAPTAATIKQAFIDMYPSLTQVQRDTKMKLMYFTPILFDNSKKGSTTNDSVFAVRVKGYIDSMVNAGIADGFELNFKSYPVGSAAYANTTNDNVFLLQEWPALGDATTPTRNFVEYIHSKHLPVGIFASVPEVCAIPDFNTDGSRNAASLVSGFVKEDYNNNFNPKVVDQGTYDFRGDWNFYISAGVDFVITDRPDALREYLKAIGRFQ